MNYFDLLENILTGGNECSPRKHKIKELINVKLIINTQNFYYSPQFRPFEKLYKYLIGELAWYFSGNKKVENISKYSKFWLKLQDETGNANSNYGDLALYKRNMSGITSFEWVVNELKNDKDSRRAIMLYNDRDCYYLKNKDFICTQSQHFFIRSGQLISIVNLRSSDAILGLSYDIPWWSIIQQQVAKKLNARCGRTEVNIGSSHLYENNFELAKNILLDKSKQGKYIYLNEIIPLNKEFKWYENNIENYLNWFKDTII